jgi:hypothetical protein
MRHSRTSALASIASATAVAAVAALGLAACGSSSKAAGSSPGGAAASGGGASSAETAANPAGDIPDTTVFVPFKTSSGHVEVKVPQGWSRTSDASGVLFTDKLNSVRVQEIPAAAAPTVGSARTDEVPRIQSGAAAFKLGDVTSVQRKGGTAVRIAYNADSAPDAVTGKVTADAFERYEFFWNGTKVVVTLSGPVSADNVDPWKTVSDSVRWLS